MQHDLVLALLTIERGATCAGQRPIYGHRAVAQLLHLHSSRAGCAACDGIRAAVQWQSAIVVVVGRRNGKKRAVVGGDDDTGCFVKRLDRKRRASCTGECAESEEKEQAKALINHGMRREREKREKSDLVIGETSGKKKGPIPLK